MPEFGTGCIDSIDDDRESAPRVRSSTAQDDTDGARGNGSSLIGEQGEMHFSEAQRQRWGMSPGAEFVVHDTPDGLLLRRKDAALHKLYVEPTSACNLSCRTCVRQSWSEPTGTMSMETYRRLIEGLREVPTLHTMAFWGFGEPLLHPQIVEMVAMAKELGVKTELITNALLLDEEMAQGLVSAGLDTLVVSIDGASAEAYAEIRSGGNLAEVQKNVTALQAISRADARHDLEIGIEFVVMRRNVNELPQLHRLAYALGASFIVVSNVLPYTEELKDEILYGLWAGRAYPTGRSEWMPEIQLPRMDARPEAMEPAMALLHRSGYVQPAKDYRDGATGYCRFVNEGSAAVAWDGMLSPCVALMHSYSCYVMRRLKEIKRYTLGNVAQEDISDLWEASEYRGFRDLVRRFDFAPCTDCSGCHMSESNEEDCFGNTFPVCGDCLWAKGVIQCP